MSDVPARKQILLIDGTTREPVPAVLIEDVSEQELHAVDVVWVPYTAEAKREALRRGVPSGDLPEHGHWQWAPLYAAEDCRFLGIECGGDTQALMLVRTDKTCRLLGQVDLPLIYVDRLATAPWNYGKFLALLGRTVRYRKAGDLLLRAAILLSREMGWGGRIGLHALPQAESFYRDRHMSDLGIDSGYEGLRYFEMTPEQSRRLMGGE